MVLRLWLPIFLVIAGCQTIPKKPPVMVVLPAYLHSQFDECLSANGTLEVDGAKKNSYNFNGELDWRVNNKHDFAFEVVNSVGQGLWKVDREGELFDVSGLYAAELPKLSVEKSTRKLLVGRYFSGFLVHEIPCLFKFKLPSAWQEQIIRSAVKGKVTSLDVYDPYRTISITIDQTKSVDQARVCSKIQWKAFLGMSNQEIIWCNEKIPGRKITNRASLDVSNQLSLKWTQADEG